MCVGVRVWGEVGGRAWAGGTLSMYARQARVLVPSMFMAQEPQMPSRHDLSLRDGMGGLSVGVGSQNRQRSTGKWEDRTK